jgi:SigmaK-factor processing regulatory protein BofA
MEWVVLIVVVIAVVAVLVLVARTTALLVGLAVNAIIGLILLFLTNLFVSPPIPINLLNILICAIGGVVGWLIILVLHLLQIAF